jgi:hypothetical protein
LIRQDDENDARTRRKKSEDGRNERRNAKRNARNEINKIKTESLKVIMILRLSANIKQTTMQLLDGKKQQKKISRAKLLLRSKMKDKGEKFPFSSAYVGNDGASLTYVGSKESLRKSRF